MTYLEPTIMLGLKMVYHLRGQFDGANITLSADVVKSIVVSGIGHDARLFTENVRGHFHRNDIFLYVGLWINCHYWRDLLFMFNWNGLWNSSP